MPGAKKAKGATSFNLINGETKSEVFNLRPDVSLKKKGGLILSWTGARIEVPLGAAVGTKTKFVSAPVPAAVRSFACPWLGPNLRLASDVQLLWCSNKLKKPVHCFIPLTLPCTMHLTTNDVTQKTSEALKSMITAAVENAKAAAKAAAEAATANAGKPDASHAPAGSEKKTKKRDKKEKKRGGRHDAKVEYVNLGVPLLDTRSIFVLQAKVGEDFWTLKKDVQIVQPSIHFMEWPSRLRKEAFAAGQFSEMTKAPRNTASANSTGNAGDLNGGGSHAIEKEHKKKGKEGGKKKGAGGSKGGAAGPPETRLVDIIGAMKAAKDAVPPLDVAKRSSAFRGGISFQADEFSDFIAIVVGTPSETVTFDLEGGLLRSPILHPLMSVRVPKLALKDTKTSTFKAVQIRPELINAIHHFDSQLTEINECSNIYELDLGNAPFDRPITITIPLPLWYTKLVEKMLAPQNQDLMGFGIEEGDGGEAEQEGGEKRPVSGGADEGGPDDQIEGDKSNGGGSVSHGSLSPTSGRKASKKKSQINANNDLAFLQRPEKHLVLVYQRPNQKRQLVWRPCSGDPNSDNIVNRKKQQRNGKYRDITVSPVMRGENMNAKNGWLHLLLGLKGAPWKDVPINGPFTPRCLQINSYQLGRFALIHSNDPIRTPSSKLAHMMSRMEALSVAPPGVLLPCLQTTANKVSLWINCVPSTKIIDVLEERLQAGFIPLVQTNASPSRRCAAVANSTYQLLPHLMPQIESDEDRPTIPNYGQSNYRVSGFDLLRVLLYNGLCIRVVIRGHMQIKTQGVFDCFTNIYDHRKKTTSAFLTNPSSVDGAESPTFDESALNVGGKGAAKGAMAANLEVPAVTRPDQYITRMETRFAYNDLMPETATVIELEPIREYFAQKIQQRLRKERLIRDLMNRRLEEIEKKGSGSPESSDFIKSPERQVNNIHDVSIDRENSCEETVNEDSSAGGVDTPHANNSKWTVSTSTAVDTTEVSNTEDISLSSNHADEDADDDGDDGDDGDDKNGDRTTSWSPEPEAQDEGHNASAAEDAADADGVEWVGVGDPQKEVLPGGLDGDDEKTSKQHFVELLKAFSAKNSALLGFEVAKDICRRLTNIYDKGLAYDAKEFIKTVYELNVAARVEFHLVQPAELSQVREKPKDRISTNLSNNQETLGDIDEVGDYKDAILGRETEIESQFESAKNEDDDESERTDFQTAENQSNMKWNRNMGIADPQDGDPLPLASFDLLIDPELFSRWAPKGKKVSKVT